MPEFAAVGVWEGEGEGEVAEGVLLPMGFLVEVEVGERVAQLIVERVSF